MPVFCRTILLPDPLVSLQHNLICQCYTVLYQGQEGYLSRHTDRLLDGRPGARVRFPVRARNFSLFRRFYASFRTHQNLFSMGCRKSFAEVKQPKGEAHQSPSCSVKSKNASRHICPSKKIYGSGQLSRYNGWLRTGRPGFDSRQGQDIFFSSQYP